jgi:hypothetical protein
VATSTDDRRQKRLHREVNLRIRDVARTFPAGGAVEFLCECGRPECTATIELTPAQWDSLFSLDDVVLLVAEHRSAADGRRLVAENGRFVLTEAA